MKLKLSFMRYYCATDCFLINGVEASSDDFGDQEDADLASAESYSCGNMVFTAKLPTQEVLDKYGIAVDEYKQICETLEEGLSFGRCSCCV